MMKLEVGDICNIQAIKNESYHDCKFVFDKYRIMAVDGQYFQIFTPYVSGKNTLEYNSTWWDSEGFKITKVKEI